MTKWNEVFDKEILIREAMDKIDQVTLQGEFYLKAAICFLARGHREAGLRALEKFNEEIKSDYVRY